MIIFLTCILSFAKFVLFCLIENFGAHMCTSNYCQLNTHAKVNINIYFIMYDSNLAEKIIYFS